MSEYTEALAELAALPQQLEERIARSEREVAAERKRRETEIEGLAAEHEAVVARLEAVLGRARGEGVDPAAATASGEDRDPSFSAEPIEYARQLVGRLEEALSHYVYTRDALAAEEERLSEEERRRLAEERLRREREELRRGEQWERATQGTRGLLVGLGVVTAAGLAGGLLGSPGVLVLPLLAAVICFALTMGVVSTLPALAVQRASGTAPRLPAAPPRETRLAGAGYAAAALALCALGVAVTGFGSDAKAPVPTVALGLVLSGVLALAAVWLILPHRR